MLSTAVASPAPLLMSSNEIPHTTLTARQGIQVPVCAFVAVDIPLSDTLQTLANNIFLLGPIVAGLIAALPLGDLELDLGSLCLCAVAGVLTPQSVLRLSTAVNTNASSGLLGIVGRLGTTVLQIVQPLALGILNPSAGAPVCTYPSNSTPVAPADQECGSTCPFTCNANFELCNGQCIAEGSPCATAGGSRKRSVKDRSRFACRQPFTACPVSHFLSRDEVASSYGGGFECVDTTADLESCGGCTTPFKGNALGVDCTALPFVNSVTCLSGRCIVESCAPGFVPSSDGHKCVEKSQVRYGSSRLTVQSRKQVK